MPWKQSFVCFWLQCHSGAVLAEALGAGADVFFVGVAEAVAVVIAVVEGLSVEGVSAMEGMDTVARKAVKRAASR